LRAPGFWNTDSSAVRDFPLGGERPGPAVYPVDVARVRRITSYDTHGPRTIQLSLKLLW